MSSNNDPLRSTSLHSWFVIIKIHVELQFELRLIGHREKQTNVLFPFKTTCILCVLPYDNEFREQISVRGLYVHLIRF